MMFVVLVCEFIYMMKVFVMLSAFVFCILIYRLACGFEGGILYFVGWMDKREYIVPGSCTRYRT
jgi:hypothetical protein